MIRLAIVDDHPAIAAAIEATIRDRDDIVLVGSVTTATAAAGLVAQTEPDVLLCDLWLDGEAAGLDVLASLAGPRSGDPATHRPRVLVLSGFDQPSFLRAAFEGGAAGYLSKASPVAEIVEAVMAVARGETCFPAVTLRALRDAPRRPSARDLGAIRLLARGASNDEMAGKPDRLIRRPVGLRPTRAERPAAPRRRALAVKNPVLHSRPCQRTS